MELIQGCRNEAEQEAAGAQMLTDFAPDLTGLLSKHQQNDLCAMP